MLGSCRLNNKSMRNVRRTDAYQAMAIDLALLGVISKEECEMLLDGGIPSGIVLPDGSSKLMSEKELPPKPDFIQTEDEDTEGNEAPEIVTPNAGIVGTRVIPPDAGTVVTDGGSISPEPIPGVTEMPGSETVSDGATTDEQPSVDPVDVADGLTDQEPVNDEGRTESDN